ncbi:MAG: METTL5 family protein [Candidatus Thermoplasmatota archaeon]|jgi:putative methylase|nr:METTL5 family protein [Candidatus Thermoplasmatota archaeon]
MVLSRLDDMTDPVPRLEQYRTPSEAVSDILFLAVSLGDIEGRSVAELGCGGAPFLIGAVLLGASRSYGCDIDERAVDLARNNASRVRSERPDLPGWSDLTIEIADVSDPGYSPSKVDTILMNPPFGAQSRRADRPFMERAMEMASVIHSVHNRVSYDFIRGMLEGKGWQVTHRTDSAMEIKRRFHFHDREKVSVPTVRIRAVKGT